MDVETLQSKFEILAPALTERSRRLWAATEALALGHGGIALVARATGMARSTISRGIQELESGEALNPDRARRPGGGRKRTIDKDIALLADLEALLDPTTAGAEECRTGIRAVESMLVNASGSSVPQVDGICDCHKWGTVG